MAFLRSRWRFFAPFLAVSLGVSGAALFVFGRATVAYAVGIFQATMVWLVVLIVVETTGTANMRMGALAEAWTAGQLAKLDRRGWRLFHGIPTERGDVDHVLVGPGGVLAFETKWSSTDWADRKNAGSLERAAEQAWRSARSVKSRLRSAGQVLDVLPVVVLWSSADELGDVPGMDGITAMRGDALRKWILALPDVVLSPSEVAEAGAAIEGYLDLVRAKRLAPPENRFVEVGPGGVAQDIGVGVSAGMTTFFIGVVAIAELRLPYGLGVVLVLALALAGLRRARWGPRVLWLGGLVGAISVMVILATALGGAYFFSWFR